MEQLKVSVIVSTYNGSETLPKLMETLLAQTLDSYEIILADDCSKDNTRELIAGYAAQYPDKVVPLYMEQNTRGSGTFNAAVPIARGKYVAFMDQDDWVAPSMYEKLYNIAERNQADVADGISQVVDSSGTPIGPLDYQNTTFDNTGVIDKEKRKRLFVAFGRRNSKIFRKDFLIENDIHHTDNVCYGDNYFGQIVTAYVQKLVKVESDEPLYFYRADNVSTTRSINNPITYDRLKSAKMAIDELTERGFMTEYKDEIEFRFIELFYVNSAGIFLSLFKPCEIEKLRYMRQTVKQNCSDYRKNKYFRERMSKGQKLVTLLCDISPWLLCRIWGVMSLIKKDK